MAADPTRWHVTGETRYFQMTSEVYEAVTAVLLAVIQLYFTKSECYSKHEMLLDYNQWLLKESLTTNAPAFLLTAYCKYWITVSNSLVNSCSELRRCHDRARPF